MLLIINILYIYIQCMCSTDYRSISTNFRIYEYSIFPRTTKIGIREFKLIQYSYILLMVLLFTVLTVVSTALTFSAGTWIVLIVSRGLFRTPKTVPFSPKVTMTDLQPFSNIRWTASSAWCIVVTGTPVITSAWDINIQNRQNNSRNKGPPWSYGSWIYNYICNQCLSPLMWVRISIRARCTTLCDKVCQWLATGRWFSPGPAVSSTNKTDRHDITEILLKVALNTKNQTKYIWEHIDLFLYFKIQCRKHWYQPFLSM